MPIRDADGNDVVQDWPIIPPDKAFKFLALKGDEAVLERLGGGELDEGVAALGMWSSCPGAQFLWTAG